jgi:hypothetical protein
MFSFVFIKRKHIKFLFNKDKKMIKKYDKNMIKNMIKNMVIYENTFNNKSINGAKFDYVKVGSSLFIKFIFYEGNS